MLKTLIEKDRFSFSGEFEKWEDAIIAACQPLIKEGAIEKEYPDYIIKNVHEFGPYIVIAPDVCIPHAQEGKGVNETSVCFMNTTKAVDFGEECDYDARLFFVLASVNNDEHLQNLSELVELLEDEENVSKLVQARTKEDLIRLIK